VAYEVDGVELAGFPADLDVLARVNVRYVTFPGWKTSIAACRAYDELPAACRAYVAFVEEFLGVPIRWIGVGPDREAMIVR